MPRDSTCHAEVFAWARQRRGVLMAVVQDYRFSRRQSEGAQRARMEAALAVERADPTLSNPMGYAMILLEWIEHEHRDWFWRCCRNGHEL